MNDQEIKINRQKVKDFLEKAKPMTDGFLTASLTDEYIVDYWPQMRGYTAEGELQTLEGKEDKILEIRIFNTEQERKLFRGDIGRKFQERLAGDFTEINAKEYYDELQLLDIDEKRSKGSFEQMGRVVTMGGGSYYLPLASTEGARAHIRYYLSKYETSGQARVCDWRLVSFTNERNLKEE